MPSSASADPKSFPAFEIGPARYRGSGVIATGMTGRILRLSETRVVKVARIFPTRRDNNGELSGNDFTNASNREALQIEKAIFDRLGDYDGIIHCFEASNDGIELEYANQGDLRRHIQTEPEPHRSVKIAWVLSLAKSLSYIHSRKVFVDEIALRNILVHNGQLKFADFGQSIMLLPEADMETVCEQDLTVKLKSTIWDGSFIQSVFGKSTRFTCFNPAQSKPSLPSLRGLLFEEIVQNCWDSRYMNASELQADIMAVHEAEENSADKV